MKITHIVESKCALIVAVGMAMVTAGCSSAYNEYYEEVKVPDTNVTNGEDGETFTDEIIPTLSDPHYEIRATKGAGPFEPYSQDAEHWLNAPFHTFALMTENSRNGQGSVNYAATDDTHRLLWDVPYFMENAQGGGHFHESYDRESNAVPRYYNEHKDYRYKFFIVHADDNVRWSTGLNATTKRVTYKVSLDGRQDLMHAFAYHTKEQYNAAVAQLPADRTTALFLSGNKPEGSAVENEYIYSGMSGNRGIHPIFNMNHLLTRLRIRVQGVAMEDEVENGYFFNLIDGVTIKAPGEATLVVADDDWERDEYKRAVAAGELLEADETTMKDYESMVENRPMSETGTEYGVNFVMLDEEYRNAKPSGTAIYDETVAYHHVKSTESEYLSEDIMVPPMESYKLVWKGRYLFTSRDESGKVRLGREKRFHLTPVYNDEGEIVDWETPSDALESDYYRAVSSDHTIDMKDDNGNPVKFEPGKTYTINLFVYGNSEIGLQIVPEVKWEEGGDIERGKDGEFTGEGYE